MRTAPGLRLILMLCLVFSGHAWAQTTLPTATTQPTSQPARGTTFDSGAWNTIVSTYVLDGVVDYPALSADEGQMSLLDDFVASLAEVRLDGWARDELLTFWINAYNALVVKAVIDNWPVDSVLNLDGFFDSVTYQVAGRVTTLNQLENAEIREVFEEPRSHFALVCAAQSCPPLRSEAYEAAQLEEQLEEQTTRFVRASTRFDEASGTVYVSRIFEWYEPDFVASGGYREFVATYLEPAAAEAVRAADSTVAFDEYDWAVNSR